MNEGFGADAKAPAIGGTDPAGADGNEEMESGVAEAPVGSAPNAIDQGRRAAEIITESSALPLGWKGENPFGGNKTNPLTKTKDPGWSWSEWISHFLGWSPTAFALTLGAPFWFDTLMKVVNLRTSGVSPEHNAKEKSAS